jgi:ELWxxDGT repeat protein
MNRLLLVFVIFWVPVTQISAATGARQLADLNPGAGGSYPSNFTAFGGALYFSAYTLSNGFELWRYDGNSVTLAADINPTIDDIGFGVKEGNDSVPSWLTIFGGQLYFSAFHPGRGAELWRFNGSGAERVSDINPDQNDTIKTIQNSSWPNQLTVVNESLYFGATSSTTPENYELWRYNASGTQRVANLHPDIGTNQSSYPTGLTTFNGALYFMADDGTHGWELWKHDGVETKLFDLNPGGPQSSSYPKDFAAFNNELYFPAFSDATGFELWRTDGNTATLAADVQAGAASSYPKYLTAYNGALYFQGFEAATGYELRRFAGGQSTLALDINPGGDSAPKNLTVVGNVLVFAATDGVHGFELWKYDGTSATMLLDLNTAGDSFPENFTVLNGTLYFTATTPETGYEVFKFDGTSITLAAEVNEGPADSFPRNLTAVNGQLYFSATDGSSNWEPWVLDATAPANQPPTVSLASPVEGMTFLTTENISLSATATDDAGIARVEFYTDGALLGADETAPFTLSTTLPAGSHSISAKAIDSAGASATSPIVTITVREPAVNQPPTVSLTSPLEGATFLTTDRITITADAKDDSGVVRVEFYANGSLLGVDSAAPYSFDATLPAGTHAITAKVFDAEEASGTSGIVTITVREPAVNQVPTATLTAPSEGAMFLTTDNITLAANASDDSAVERVEFYSNSVLLGTDSTAPYALSATLQPGTYAITAKAYDAAGASGTSGAVTITVRQATAARPAFTSVARSGDSIVLTVSGTSGVPHAIQASSDLVNWTTLETRTPTNGTITFSDAATDPKRFYRVVAQ